MGNSQKHCAEQNKTDTKEDTLYGPTYMKFEKRQI